MSLPPQRILPPEWTPTPEVLAALTAEFGHLVDLTYLLRKFRLYYVEGQVSRNWDARFSAWVLSDAQRASHDGKGTDDLGIPRTQRKVSELPDAAQPGDVDYWNPDDPTVP